MSSLGKSEHQGEAARAGETQKKKTMECVFFEANGGAAAR
jgi:hypothetical protein